MESLKRIVRAVAYGIVGSLGGGIGAAAGSILKVLKSGIQVEIIICCVFILVDVFLETINIFLNRGIIFMVMVMFTTLFFSRVRYGITIMIIVFGITSVFLGKEVWESIVRFRTMFLMLFLFTSFFPPILYFLKYAVRGAAMGTVRGTRGGAFGGGLGGAMNGIVNGIVYGSGLGTIVIANIELFLMFFGKYMEIFCEKYYLWIILIFTLLVALGGLLGLIIGVSKGVRKYTSKSIQKNDNLRDVFRSVFKYALRGAQLNDLL